MFYWNVNYTCELYEPRIQCVGSVCAFKHKSATNTTTERLQIKWQKWISWGSVIINLSKITVKLLTKYIVHGVHLFMAKDKSQNFVYHMCIKWFLSIFIDIRNIILNIWYLKMLESINFSVSLYTFQTNTTITFITVCDTNYFIPTNKHIIFILCFVLIPKLYM